MIKNLLALLIAVSTFRCIYTTKLPIENSFQTSGPIVIEDVSFVSGKPDEKVLEHINLLINNGVIEKISKNKISVVHARVINGTGFQVIPSLINLHTHLTSSGGPPWLTALGDPKTNLSAFLYAGVTTVVDLFGNASQLQSLKTELDNNKSSAQPQFFYAGKAFTAVGGHPAAILNERIPWIIRWYIKDKLIHEVDDKSNIKEMMAENIKHKAHLTKVFIDQIPLGVKTLQRKQIIEIVKASEAANLPVVAHIGSEQDIIKALDSGIKIFVHGPYRSELSDATIQRMAKEKVLMMPTAIVWQSITDVALGKKVFNGLDKIVLDKKVAASYNEREKLDDKFKGWIDNLLKYKYTKYEIFKRLRKAGIKLIAASDSPNVGVTPGSGIHHEMELWVSQAGVSPKEALAAATWLPGRFLEEKWHVKGLGYLSEGNPANLLVIQGDIRKSISHTQNITFVIYKGRLVQRKIIKN